MYKGYIGVVRSATDSTAKVEIHSKNKIIKIDKKDLVAVGDRNGEIQDASNVQAFDNEALTRTPMVGMQTPINVMATPMIGQSTPMHTPLHDGSATPAAEDAWDPSVSFTPQRVENIKNEDDQSSYAGSSMGGPGGYSTPSMNSYQPSTPTSLAVQSPAPDGALPHTPAASYDFNGPTTPNAASTIAPTTPMSDAISTNAPHTPQSTGVIGDSSSYWFKNDMEVIVHGKVGVIKSVQDGECQVVFDDENTTESVPEADARHVQPDKNDKVIVTSGDNEVARGSTGTLIGVDDADGIVKMDSDLEIKILPMAMLAKLR
jgi:transcription elongation factor SPT5